MDFSWLIKQLCSVTILKWHRNIGHDAVPLNSDGFAALAPFPFPHSVLSPGIDFFQLRLEFASGRFSL
jgi:hypothetical protein